MGTRKVARAGGRKNCQEQRVKQREAKSVATKTKRRNPVPGQSAKESGRQKGSCPGSEDKKKKNKMVGLDRVRTKARGRHRGKKKWPLGGAFPAFTPGPPEDPQDGKKKIQRRYKKKKKHGGGGKKKEYENGGYPKQRKKQIIKHIISQQGEGGGKDEGRWGPRPVQMQGNREE